MTVEEDRTDLAVELAAGPGSALPSRRAGRRVGLWAGTVVGVAVAVFLLRGAFSTVPDALASITPGWLVAAFALLGIANVVRARRMRGLLSVPLAVPESFALVCAYNLATAVLPGGLGELALPLRLARRHGAPPAEAASTLVLTRLLDLAGLLGTALLSALLLPGLGEYRLPAVLACAAALTAAALFTVRLRSAMGWARPRLARLAERPGRWASRAGRVLGVFGEALVAQRLRVSRMTVFDTALMWALVWASVVAEVRAVGPPLPWAAGGLAMAVVFLLTAIPVRSVAGIGLQEAGWVLVLTAFVHLDREQAAATGVALHVVTLAMLLALWPVGFLVARAARGRR